MSAIGFIFIAIAIFFNGTFIVPYKHILREIPLNPLVFNLYLSFGIFLSSWILQLFLPLNHLIVSGADNSFSFPALGLVSGLLIILAIGANIIAVECVGLAMAQGVVGGTALVTSFLWGLKFDGVPKGVVVSSIGVLVIVGGVMGIAFSKNILDLISSKRESNDPLLATLVIEEGTDMHKIKSVDITVNNDGNTQSGSQPLTFLQVFTGVGWAMLAGLCGGTFLVPQNYVPQAQQGIPYLAPYGTGCLLTAPVLLAATAYFKGMPELHLQWRTVLLSVVAGFMFNMFTIFSIAAIPLIGFALATPLGQVSIVVAGCWSILLFKVTLTFLSQISAFGSRGMCRSWKDMPSLFGPPSFALCFWARCCCLWGGNNVKGECFIIGGESVEGGRAGKGSGGRGAERRGVRVVADNIPTTKLLQITHEQFLYIDSFHNFE